MRGILCTVNRCDPMNNQTIAISVCMALLVDNPARYRLALLRSPVSRLPSQRYRPVTTVQSSCGFTTCHGPDLACGSNTPQSCSGKYQSGDICRQYAQCSSGSDGSCTLVTSQQFASRKACVENCAIKSGVMRSRLPTAKRSADTAGGGPGHYSLPSLSSAILILLHVFARPVAS